MAYMGGAQSMVPPTGLAVPASQLSTLGDSMTDLIGRALGIALALAAVTACSTPGQTSAAPPDLKEFESYARITLEAPIEGSAITVVGEGCGVWTDQPAEWVVSLVAFRLPHAPANLQAASTPVGEVHESSVWNQLGIWQGNATVRADGTWSVGVPVGAPAVSRPSSRELPARLTADCHTTYEPLGGFRYAPVDLTG